MNDKHESGEKTCEPLKPCALAVAPGSAGSIPVADEYPDCEEPAPTCDRCGGDGYIDYIDGDGGDWGEDCPSEENHLIVCRACGGTGYAQ